MQLSFPLHAAFIAIPLEGEAKAAFQEIQASLDDFSDILRFQKPESPHLTLIFWKEMMEIEYHQVLTHAEKISRRSGPFTISVNGCELFSDQGGYRVLFLTIAFSPELAALKKLCPWPSFDRLRMTTGEWVPHITLARIVHPQRFARVRTNVMKRLKNVACKIAVDRLRLYANVEGKSQAVLKDFPF